MLRRLATLIACISWLAGCQSPTSPALPTQATSAPTAPSAPAAPQAVAASPSAARPTAAPPSVSASRVDVLNSALAAYAAGDPSAAAALFERVINTPPAPDEGAVAQTITDFAGFEAVVASLAAGREDDARAQLDTLQAHDSTAPLARMANQVWDQYGMTGSLRAACSQLQPQIAQAAAAVTALQGAGVKVDTASLCAAAPAPSR